MSFVFQRSSPLKAFDISNKPSFKMFKMFLVLPFKTIIFKGPWAFNLATPTEIPFLNCKLILQLMKYYTVS